jgi:hypothetical protein
MLGETTRRAPLGQSRSAEENLDQPQEQADTDDHHDAGEQPPRRGPQCDVAVSSRGQGCNCEI